jgi:hypothetical protein
VLEENRTRLQFFQERLEYEADKGASLKHLQEHYAKFLQGVLVEETDEASADQSDKNGKRPGCCRPPVEALHLVMLRVPKSSRLRPV